MSQSVGHRVPSTCFALVDRGDCETRLAAEGAGPRFLIMGLPWFWFTVRRVLMQRRMNIPVQGSPTRCSVGDLGRFSFFRCPRHSLCLSFSLVLVCWWTIHILFSSLCAGNIISFTLSFSNTPVLILHRGEKRLGAGSRRPFRQIHSFHFSSHPDTHTA